MNPWVSWVEELTRESSLERRWEKLWLFYAVYRLPPSPALLRAELHSLSVRAQRTT